MRCVKKKKPGRPRDEALAERRREEILGAAGKIFARYGYRNTDVQRIADKLKIGKGTVYRYFKSKRELFLATVDYYARTLHEQTEQAVSAIEDPLDRLLYAAKCFLAFFDAHPEMVELIIQERAEFKDRAKTSFFVYNEAYVKPWQELLRGLIAAGRVRDLPIETITDIGDDMLYGAIFTSYFAGRSQSLELQAQKILDITLLGILSDTERAARSALEK